MKEVRARRYRSNSNEMDEKKKENRTASHAELGGESMFVFVDAKWNIDLWILFLNEKI